MYRRVSDEADVHGYQLADGIGQPRIAQCSRSYHAWAG